MTNADASHSMSGGTGESTGDGANRATVQAVLPDGTGQERGAGGASGSGFGGVRAGWEALRGFWSARWKVIVVVMGVCMAWDRAAYLHLARGARLGNPEAMRLKIEELERSGAYLALKVCGELWVALAIAVGLILRDWAVLSAPGGRTAGGRTTGGRTTGGGGLNGTRLMRRAVFVVLTPALGGLAAEVCKGVTRRQRPIVALDEAGLGGWYHFRWWWDEMWDWGNLGFVSSHAAVAFGTAFALCALWGRLSTVWIALAVLCAMTRVISGAHFLSDVCGGLVVAYAAFVLVYEADRANNQGVGIERGWAGR